MQKALAKSAHILIVGGGLGGLALAQGLKQATIPFTVFERDVSADFRAQGYRIRINEDGSESLRKVLIPELWSLFESTCAELKLGGAQINALDGSVISSQIWPKPPQNMAPSNVETKKVESGPYVADRKTLRSLLMLGLENNIVFGKEFKEYKLTEGGVTVHFSDGSSYEGTLLVGADGVRSRIRRQYLPEHVLVDTDGRCIYGKTPITSELLEKFTADAMNGMTLVMEKKDKTPLTLFLEAVTFKEDPAKESDGKLPSVKDYIYWVLGSRKATFGLEDTRLLRLSNEEASELSLKLTENWAPTIKSLFELQDKSQSSSLRMSSIRPDIPAWTPSAYVTLLGDAIHAMSPTGGSGANTALRDARNLCEAIIEGATEEGIGNYEMEMRSYAKLAVERSYMGGKKMYDQPPFDECKPLTF